MVTDALGMFLGTGYSVEMIQIIEDNGDPHVFGVRPLDADGKTLGFAQEEQLFEQVLKMSAADVFFSLCNLRLRPCDYEYARLRNLLLSIN